MDVAGAGAAAAILRQAGEVNVTAKPHLVGAYGMFWDRESVNWFPGAGGYSWQMLGYINKNQPVIRTCDFRQAKGFYVLFDDFRATYAGLARGSGGIGSRLRSHVTHKDGTWNRFCWFSFDDTVDVDSIRSRWHEIRPRDALKNMTAEAVLRESEALLITILGLRDQNEMKFLNARKWTQLTAADFTPGGVGFKVDESGFSDSRYYRLATGA